MHLHMDVVAVLYQPGWAYLRNVSLRKFGNRSVIVSKPPVSTMGLRNRGQERVGGNP